MGGATAERMCITRHSSAAEIRAILLRMHPLEDADLAVELELVITDQQVAGWKNLARAADDPDKMIEATALICFANAFKRLAAQYAAQTAQ